MMKSSLPVIATLLLASCGNDEYLGGNVQDATQNTTISFDGGTGRTSRASMLTGSAAADKLGKQFIVYGTKTSGATDPLQPADGTTQTVYDFYSVNYISNSAGTTESNSNDWEYVGQPLSTASSLPDGSEQSVKYWDFGAQRYDFVALSTGEAAAVKSTVSVGGQPALAAAGTEGKVVVTPMSTISTVAPASPLATSAPTAPAFTIVGRASDLAKCFIADRVTATKSGPAIEGISSQYQKAVAFKFRPIGARVRLGLYETIPGYSVKDVRFYTDATSDASALPPALFSATATIPATAAGGEDITDRLVIAFPTSTGALDATGYNIADVTFAGSKAKSVTIGTALTPQAAPELSETGGSVFLGRSPSDASMTTDVTLLPCDLDALTLKIDFTLVSIDYNETIEVKGATAVVPATFTQLKPNTAYTYIFKLSDAMTNVFGQVLFPITFDALETVDNDGVQQTITTVDQPSITTYALGALGSDYYVGDHIYVAVANGTPKVLTAANTKLYTVTLTNSFPLTDVTEKEITEHIHEITAGTHGIHFADASSALTFTNVIDAQDSSTGDKVTAADNYFAKFTAANETYVFEYSESDPVYYQTVEEYNADKGESLSQSDFDALPLTDRIKSPAGTKHYKVIRVTSGSRS